MSGARAPAAYCMKCGHDLKPKIDGEGKSRLTCSDAKCGFIFYNNPLPVVGAIVEYMGPTRDSVPSTAEVILVQNVGWPKDWFGIVTGFLEKGEDAAAGVLREVKEELGLESEIVRFVGVYDFKRMNQVMLIWHVRAYGTIVTPPNEIQAYKRVPISKLQPWPMGTGPAVKDFLLDRAKQLQQQQQNTTATSAVVLPPNRTFSTPEIISKL